MEGNNTGIAKQVTVLNKCGGRVRKAADEETVGTRIGWTLGKRSGDIGVVARCDKTTWGWSAARKEAEAKTILSFHSTKASLETGRLTLTLVKCENAVST